MAALADWMAGYERAWASNDPDEIHALFTADALYFTTPLREPWRGPQEIVDGWLERQDEPGGWTFEWQPLVDTPELAIVTGTTTYVDPSQVYSNLWVLRLAEDGRCSEFTEWWMLHDTGEE
jgi:ketosteroid isomerase-like protein